MRVNIYAEELKDEVLTVEKNAENGNKFVGIRFILDSPLSLHYRDNDDDRSAVTFWIPGSQYKGYKVTELKAMFQQAIQRLETIEKSPFRNS